MKITNKKGQASHGSSCLTIKSTGHYKTIKSFLFMRKAIIIFFYEKNH